MPLKSRVIALTADLDTFVARATQAHQATVVDGVTDADAANDLMSAIHREFLAEFTDAVDDTVAEIEAYIAARGDINLKPMKRPYWDSRQGAPSVIGWVSAYRNWLALASFSL